MPDEHHPTAPPPDPAHHAEVRNALMLVRGALRLTSAERVLEILGDLDMSDRADGGDVDRVLDALSRIGTRQAGRRSRRLGPW